MATLPEGDWREGQEEHVSEIRDCYCPNCGKSNAITMMLPTRIPLFREIIVMSLNCQDCNFRNSEVTFGGEIQEKGERIELQVTCQQDLDRQIVKSDSASLSIPSLEFEIPPGTQRGTISTLEGILRRAANNLQELQPERLKLGDLDNFRRCQHVIDKLRCVTGDSTDSDEGDTSDHEQVFPFTIVLDDPAGNSFLENPLAPKPDPNIQSTKYIRTPKEDMALGLQPAAAAMEAGTIDDSNPSHKNPVNAPKGRHAVEIDANTTGVDSSSFARQEGMKFATTCPHCHAETETAMCVTDIPHFKEVILMCLLCEKCGYKSNEIKGGGAIPMFGTKITLRVESSDDLGREVLKSDTAGIQIPELQLELEEGGLDGVYTTVEGLLNKIHDRLKAANPFGSGDAATKQHLKNDGSEFSDPSPNYVRFVAFLAKLKNCADGRSFPFTLIFSDSLSNSFIGPVPQDAAALSLQAEREGNNSCYDAYVDTGMDIEEYERTHEQNETLGLNDMKTENYRDNKAYWGTDNMLELPDRLRRLDVRGPDHPHAVGKAPVEGDVTVMGEDSISFAVPGMLQRGRQADDQKSQLRQP